LLVDPLAVRNGNGDSGSRGRERREEGEGDLGPGFSELTR